VAVVVSIRRDEGSLSVWQETAMGFELTEVAGEPFGEDVRELGNGRDAVRQAWLGVVRRPRVGERIGAEGVEHEWAAELR
jgi:hypothetical protein